MIPSIRDPLDVVVTPEPAWTSPIPDWRGIPCRLGRVEIWLPVEGTLLLRPFSLLMLLPERDPPDWLPYVLLGVQFLVEYDVSVALECASGLISGRLTIP
jgi:hypothetical protein